MTSLENNEGSLASICCESGRQLLPRRLDDPAALSRLYWRVLLEKTSSPRGRDLDRCLARDNYRAVLLGRSLDIFLLRLPTTVLASHTDAATILPLFDSELSLLDDERWVDVDSCDILGDDGLIRGGGLCFMVCMSRIIARLSKRCN